MVAFLPEHMEPHVSRTSTTSVFLWVLLAGTLRRSCKPTSAWSHSRPFGASGKLPEAYVHGSVKYRGSLAGSVLPDL